MSGVVLCDQWSTSFGATVMMKHRGYITAALSLWPKRKKSNQALWKG